MSKHHNKEEEQEMEMQSADREQEGMSSQEAETAEQELPEEKSGDAVRIAELEEKCADLADKNLRMMAEFDNYRRRTNKEKLELMKTAGEDIFKDMLPLIDDFERAREAMSTSDDVEALREGVELIYNKFQSFLQKHDVHEIPTEGADFSTEFHEAVTLFPAPTEAEKGKVIDCTQKGYTLGEKVIRYAKVVVGE